MGFAQSRAAARQLVAHAHLDINGHPIDVASYLVKPGDRITVRLGRRESTYEVLDLPTRPVPKDGRDGAARLVQSAIINED